MDRYISEGTEGRRGFDRLVLRLETHMDLRTTVLVCHPKDASFPQIASCALDRVTQWRRKAELAAGLGVALLYQLSRRQALTASRVVRKLPAGRPGGPPLGVNLRLGCLASFALGQHRRLNSNKPRRPCTAGSKRQEQESHLLAQQANTCPLLNLPPVPHGNWSAHVHIVAPPLN
jgi:hypothetical protein